MLKRGASSKSTFKRRKRKRNGVSTSCSVLDAFDTPLEEPELMQVWHTNAEDPCTSWQSAVPIPSEPLLKGAGTGEVGEEFGVVAPTQSPVHAKPKRK